MVAKSFLKVIIYVSLYLEIKIKSTKMKWVSSCSRGLMRNDEPSCGPSFQALVSVWLHGPKCCSPAVWLIVHKDAPHSDPSVPALPARSSGIITGKKTLYFSSTFGIVVWTDHLSDAKLSFWTYQSVWCILMNILLRATQKHKSCRIVTINALLTANSLFPFSWATSPQPPEGARQGARLQLCPGRVRWGWRLQEELLPTVYE